MINVLTVHFHLEHKKEKPVSELKFLNKKNVTIK